jgi:acyl carrier protein phosphodiesterase
LYFVSGMNFLAHLYLSANSDELTVGNFIADFVKGKPAAGLPENVAKGIALHRLIDTFTDTHPVVRQSIRRLQPAYHKYSGVIVDIFYDHFLAVNWPVFSHESLADFASKTYALINKHKAVMPVAMHEMFYYMQEQNWLVSYAQTEGVARVLQGMARRTTFLSNMELAIHDLEKDYQAYSKEFLNFFPTLIDYVQQWRSIHLHASG